MEELAKDAINNIEQVINLEKMFVQREHDLLGHLDELHMVLGHLDMTVDDQEFHKDEGPSQIVALLLIKIQELMKEEMHILREQTDKDAKSEWKVVKKLEENFIKYEIRELQEIRNSLNESLSLTAEYKKEPLFNKLVRILQFYAHLFEQIIKKEESLL